MASKRSVKTGIALLVLVLIAGMTTACNTSRYAESGRIILPAAKLTEYIGRPGTAIVDTRTAGSYAAGHVEGAVNIPVSELTINVPVQNMLTSKNKLQKVLSAAGIGNETVIVAYDDNNMSAARLFWTMLMYQNRNVLVVDGGLAAILAAGYPLTAAVPKITPASYISADQDKTWLASMQDVLNQVNEPEKNVILLDVRTDAEYQSSGKVPSSVMMDFYDNFYQDGTFKNVETTRINYLRAGIKPENEIIVYCQTSMRATAVFLRLYDAGYRNLKIYDGAFLEWTSNPNNPVDIPSGVAAPTNKDAS
jgi:thiosulfate/3-mercaptopyruvate sulfurtransferase